MVKALLNAIDVKVPASVKVQVKRRHVMVQGKLGTLKRDFKHATLTLKLLANKKGGRVIRVEVWNGDRQEIATVKSVATEIKNLVRGVQYGFKVGFCFFFSLSLFFALSADSWSTV